MAVCCAVIISRPVANCQPKPGLAYVSGQTGLAVQAVWFWQGASLPPGRKPCAPLTGGNYFQPQAVLHRQGRQLTPLMKEFIEFLKQPDPAA